jgi:hypothetical protein
MCGAPVVTTKAWISIQSSYDQQMKAKPCFTSVLSAGALHAVLAPDTVITINMVIEIASRLRVRRQTYIGKGLSSACWSCFAAVHL